MTETTLPAVSLTESAARHIAELIGEPNPENKGLRIYIETGGCSGMSYAMELAPRKPGDEEYVNHGVRLFVEDRGLVYLAGSIIDYKDGLTGAGFRITNPNAKQTCGCGNPLRPEPAPSFSTAVGDAFRKGWRATRENLPAILALQVAMAVIVALYYLWPPAAVVLARYARWQSAGGALGNGVAAALAGGLLSEVSLVYFQGKGRWTAARLESLAFKGAVFFVAGCIVFEFYRLQAWLWGQGVSLSVLVPKVLLDQLGYTPFFAAPYYALLTRWHALRYSGGRLWRELDRHFLTERMLPVLVMNWMFWIPAITLVYAMPTVLQPPLYIFATGIWGLLVGAIGMRTGSAASDDVAAASPQMLADPVE